MSCLTLRLNQKQVIVIKTNSGEEIRLVLSKKVRMEPQIHIICEPEVKITRENKDTNDTMPYRRESDE